MRGRPVREKLVAIAGGGLLASVAGYVDAVFYQLSNTAVTHVTGSVARVSADGVGGRFDDAARVVAVIAAFVVGAGISGYVVGASELRLGRRYGAVLVIEGILLIGGAALFGVSPLGALVLAACAAGLQNAMASTYARLIVRTTHLTGVATDLGFLLGMWVRHRRIEAWRFVLLLLLFAGFLSGAAGGTVATGAWGAMGLVPVGLGVGAVGSLYVAWRSLRVMGRERGVGDPPVGR